MTSKHFCLKWNNFQNSILNAFESLQNSEDLTDVTLTCEGINLKAHRFILSACSPYFRTVFKENPCSHPIVILKDVLYVDLIAIINFMYHGEVLVAEEQLKSFLETAKLLQVSGLNNSTETTTKRSLSPKKVKPLRSTESLDYPLKKAKISIKPKVAKVIPINSDNVELKKEETISNLCSNLNESFNVQTTTSANDTDDEFCSDVNENVEVIVSEKSEQGSLLEAALEVRDPKPGSILERSLTSQPAPAKSPTPVPFTLEQLNTLQILPDISKPLFIPRKPPEIDVDKRIKLDTSPSIFERQSEFLQHSIKIEDDAYETPELSPDEAFQRDASFHSKHLEAQPHHSSQCGNCPHCGKVYSNQSALKYHVRLVHSDLTNMYCCHLCPESFDYREGYKKHMVEVHCIRN